MDELKLCPVCGCEGELLKYGEQEWVSCNSTLCSLMLPFDEWQSRPLEDSLRQQLSAAQAKLDFQVKDQQELAGNYTGLAHEKEALVAQAEVMKKRLEVAKEALKRYTRSNEGEWKAGER